jgi:SRSO17 transposase
MAQEIEYVLSISPVNTIIWRTIDMDVQGIRNIGKKLKAFLKPFDDCFCHSQPTKHLLSYMLGQMSGLQRKSAEPIALQAKTPPRTLQRFLSSVQWDHPRMRDRIQWFVAREHSYPRAIGTVDETGHPKQGRHTAAVQRQYCGATGKIDNCVMSVHIGYTAGDFQCLLDSDVYLPKEWAGDMARRDAAGIPKDAIYRKKADIALDQIRHALANGIRVAAWTFDEWYGRDGEFLDGLEALGQNYVAEVPANFTGWLYEPDILLCPRTQDRHKRGRKKHFPRLAAKALPASEVRNLLVYSRVFQKQKWKKFHVKNGDNGPVVWEAKHARLYRKQGEDGLPCGAHYLIIARNVRNPSEVKYFVSNMIPGSNDITLEWLLWVGFSRWPIEKCFRQSKDELGMDHFETRSWYGIHRHLYISNLSLLFCAHLHRQLREKNDRKSVPDRGNGALLYLDMGVGSKPAAASAFDTLSRGRGDNSLPSEPQPAGQILPYERNVSATSQYGYRSCQAALLYTL